LVLVSDLITKITESGSPTYQRENPLLKTETLLKRTDIRKVLQFTCFAVYKCKTFKPV